MATETKIGLIVGLAFIICFAVILANTGKESSTPTQWPHLADQIDHARHRSDPVVSPADSHKTRKANRDMDRPPPATANAPAEHTTPARINRKGANHRVPPRPIRNAEVVASRGQENPSRLPQGVSVSPSRTTDSIVQPVAKSAEDQRAHDRRKLEKYLDSRKEPHDSSPESSDRATELGKSGDVHPQASKVRHAGGKPRDAFPDSEPSTPSRQTRRGRYVVVSGDTLTKIAAAQYGSRSRKVIDTIFEANRALLGNPDRLAVGMRLSLPAISGTKIAPRNPQPVQTRQDIQEATPARSGVSENVPGRWYQIKKNDRYVSIAREQLGDSNRWREIYQINKDRFPDPARIRWGVRIRLPSTLVATAGGS